MEKIKKRDITRNKILKAARKVFAKESYNAASIRMIANEGKFDFGLIRYHFPNKAELFKTIMKQACEELHEGHSKAMEGMNKMKTEKGFSLYLDRYLKHNFDHPETLRILMNNVYMSDDPKFETPGYDYLIKVLSLTRKILEKELSIKASRDELNRFSDSFNAQLFMFVGASSCHAGMLGLKPEDNEYRQWVKETLTYIFLPHLKRLLFL